MDHERLIENLKEIETVLDGLINVEEKDQFKLIEQQIIFAKTVVSYPDFNYEEKALINDQEIFPALRSYTERNECDYQLARAKLKQFWSNTNSEKW